MEWYNRTDIEKNNALPWRESNKGRPLINGRHHLLLEWKDNKIQVVELLKAMRCPRSSATSGTLPTMCTTIEKWKKSLKWNKGRKSDDGHLLKFLLMEIMMLLTAMTLIRTSIWSLILQLPVSFTAGEKRAEKVLLLLMIMRIDSRGNFGKLERIYCCSKESKLWNC